jgi:tripartite-type tricarboxylate transporter receptor subunit TctC
MSGNVHFMFDPFTGVSPHVKSGKLRGLAVTGPTRVAAFPDLPTVAEAGVPGYEVTTWGGIIAPAGVPKAVVARLNAEMQMAAKSRTVTERYATLGAEPITGSPEHFGTLIRTETSKWADVIKRTETGGS